MSKLYFDYDGVNNKVLPSINDTLVKLDNALVMANNISAPVNSSLAIVLSTAKTEIKKNINDLNKIKDWLERSSSTYKSRIESIQEAINTVNGEVLIKKEDWIKEVTYEK